MGRELRTRDPKAARAPLRFGDDALLWAAWLYYEEGLTQGEIAAAMGASRPTVNAYLADARAQGIVDISISTDRLRSVTIARALEDRFGLTDCLVIPGEGGPRALTDRLGSAAAQALGMILQSGDTVAVTWGRTMLAMANALGPLPLKDMTVVQATGSTTAAIPHTPEACATRLADRLAARVVPLAVPAMLSSSAARDMMLAEPVLAEQMGHLARANRILFGVSSLSANSTIHSSGFFDSATQLHGHYDMAAAALAGRFIDARGDVIDGPLAERTIGIDLASLKRIQSRVLVAGGLDKIGAILASLRGGYASVLVTDAATGDAILRAEGVEVDRLASRRRAVSKPTTDPEMAEAPVPRTTVKKFLNAPNDAVNETLEGALLAHSDFIAPIGDSPRAIRSAVPGVQGKVGLVIGGGAGHEPSFLGFVGPGLADAVAVGNVFASPPPDRVLAATRSADRGAGVLYIYGNYTGDVMNFDMASELAAAERIDTRTILTTDDVASADRTDRAARRGTAGNIFVFKAAGAACARMLSLDECERIARKANAACHTIGVALEPCSLPETLRPSFRLPPGEIEFGVGVHGEPGIERQGLQSADRITDLVCDRLFDEIAPGTKRVAVLVNSLGSTPQMELYILHRRLVQRLASRGIEIALSLVGHYCTSLDMVGASITMFALDEELESLLKDPCAGFAWQTGH